MTEGIDKAVAVLTKIAELHDNIVVGPLVWLPADRADTGSLGDVERDDRIWTVILCTPKRVRDFSVTSFGMAIVAAEHDEDMAALFDAVLVLRRVNEATFDEAQEMRAELIIKLSGRFKNVHVCEDDLVAAQTCANLWPCERADRMLRNTIAEADTRNRNLN